MARSVASAFILGALLGPVIAHAQDPVPAPDPWFGRDKALHFGASAALAAGAYAASSLVFEDRNARLISGAGIALTAGVAKEIDDLGGKGDASWRDLTWDVVGTGAGLLAAWLLDRYVVGAPERTSAPLQARGPLVVGRPRAVGLVVRF